MADNDRVVYPDEVDDVKNKVASQDGADKNTVETTPPAEAIPNIVMRNVITVPPNCPPGYKMDENGICREVFD